MKPQEIKKELQKFCEAFVNERRKKIEDDIARIEESLFSEGKSTAGDKHHTARAMLQLERENAGNQLLEVEKLETVLGKINIERKPYPIALGSWVTTSSGNYFLSISAGRFTTQEREIYCISPGTPIGRLLLGKNPGDTFPFQGHEIRIQDVK
ncbi:MAG: 3-oxoacyl-ACP synthase [Flavobacteriaceae bacterium]|nr:3-oxoacyl-ACP synthase [Flavobacteriaceae bacterium]